MITPHRVPPRGSAVRGRRGRTGREDAAKLVRELTAHVIDLAWSHAFTDAGPDGAQDLGCALRSNVQPLGQLAFDRLARDEPVRTGRQEAPVSKPWAPPWETALFWRSQASCGAHSPSPCSRAAAVPPRLGRPACGSRSCAVLAAPERA